MSKKNFKLAIAYDGTRYLGWQRQMGQTDQTIQGKIESVLTRMLEQEIEIIGSGRTDAGVHAREQIANFHADTVAKPKEILKYLNHYLPEDIAVLRVEEMDERFHARYNAKGKTYLYRIHTSEIPPVFDRKYVYQFLEPLDLDKMQQAAGLLVGEHDFRGFSSKTTKKSTIKKVHEILIEQTDTELRIYVTGSGFLYNMVRILVGTLIEVGVGKKTLEDVSAILKTKDRTQAGETVPAQGLILYEVFYE